MSKVKSSQLSKKVSVDVARLVKRLRSQKEKAQNKFHKRHPHVTLWLEKRNLDLGKIRVHSNRLLTGAGLSAALLLSPPAPSKSLPQPVARVRLAEAGLVPVSKITKLFLEKLTDLIPKRIGHLDAEDERKVSQLIEETYGVKASSKLEGQRLNHSLGWIGYEQHLKRFPGDSLSLHDEEIRAGIAPGLGAWGYFASSRTSLTDELRVFEKYYVAVQTLYIPTWKQDLRFLRDWYKYRKVLVINVENGMAVVAVVGDSGPTVWTGKQFGGSPEVMRVLDLTGKKSKGKVLLYFVDDPENKVPIGPVREKVGEVVELT